MKHVDYEHAEMGHGEEEVISAATVNPLRKVRRQ